MTIEANIKDWLEFITGLTVLQAPYKGPRPAGDYATYQIISSAPHIHGYDRRLVGGNFRRYTAADITVSVNIYADKGYSIAHNILAANDWQDARILLADGADLAFASGSAPQNLTGFGDTDFRSRWQTDLLIRADLTHDRTAYLIDSIVIEGDFVREDGGDTISITSTAIIDRDEYDVL